MTSSTQGNEKSSKTRLNAQQFSASEKDKALVTILDHLDFLRGGRPSPQAIDAKSERTQRTIERILDAAKIVFTEHGFGGLSLRKVADDAEIAVGNLTYHFPNKQILVETMLRETLTDYIRENLDQFHASRDEPIEILMNIIRFNGHAAKKHYRFFYQAWGYAASNEEARATVRSLYRPIGKFIFHLVRASNPGLDSTAARRATLSIFALEEGYKLFVGVGPDEKGATDVAKEDVEYLVRRAIQLT